MKTSPSSSTRYVFVTGGVVSSLGKGIAASSLAAILESRGLSVRMMKLDPYLNIDAGTMSPFQHGEVFVTEDGAETDLDLGYYERYLKTKTSKTSNVTTGQIYRNVMDRERRGDYLGKTVQVIPHITDEIQASIRRGAQGADVCMVEIGGTVGDIESLPFLEAIRQLAAELPRERALFMHLTLVPFVKSSGELKTKPTQHSVKELRSIGIQADVLLCRSERPLPEAERRKIALFTNVRPNAVISAVDLDDVFKIPMWLHQQGLDHLIIDHFGLGDVVRPADLSVWEKLVDARHAQTGEVRIAMVGKYVELADAYKSLNEALVHAGLHTGVRVKIQYVDSEHVEHQGARLLQGADAILVPGGFGERGVEGKIAAARFARENGVPYLGICLGMQVAVIEYARNVASLPGAHSTEFSPRTPFPVIAMITEWQDASGERQVRSAGSDKGGSMRLGVQECRLKPNTRARRIYNAEVVSERHRHRYEFNNNYREKLETAGLKLSGESMDGSLVEVIELPDHPWYVACQFHPEFTSTPRSGHPLFEDFVRAAGRYQQRHQENAPVASVPGSATSATPSPVLAGDAA